VALTTNLSPTAQPIPAAAPRPDCLARFSTAAAAAAAAISIQTCCYSHCCWVLGKSCCPQLLLGVVRPNQRQQHHLLLAGLKAAGMQLAWVVVLQW
jgi:hypothetical protein